ncbi:syntaxin-4 isoform X3 [Onychomys torridus]|uniref:syntaxin-4 isoform X3 n=1 Tax=Onychomys torridus TaxID=38674 RepID=UPI00167F5BEE|nr:syntaxin-4 isoform X3 [Onychomys torridus]
MRDRTHELRQGDNSSEDEDEVRVALVVHPGTARLGSPDDEFFQKVQTIRQTMARLESKVRELEKQQVTILATPLPEESMKQGLQNLREEIKQLGREVRAQLKANAGMVSDEELEQMLDSGQSEVFVSNILKDTQVTRQALNEISARHSEIQQLERSIRELHEIFTFLATEVEMQGEMINRIEKNILSSADYVERGQEHVKIALENQKKARKALGEPETQRLWRQGRPPAEPTLTLALCRGAYGSSVVGSCSFLEPSPSHHNVWERVCNVLFVWDTWFCKKLKN